MTTPEEFVAAARQLRGGDVAALERDAAAQAGVAVDDHPVVLPDELAGRAGTDHRRDVHAARDDGGVTGLAADVGDETGEHTLLELQHVGRREVVRHQHQRHLMVGVEQRGTLPGCRRRRHRRRDPAHHAQQALDDLLQVGLAFAQVGILHLVELAADHLQLGGQRPFGVVVPLDDPVLDAAGELLVLQQHEVHVQQRGQFGVRVGRAQVGQALLHAADLLDHHLARGAQAFDLGLDLVGLDEVVRNVEPAGRHDDGPPDGNAPGNRQTVDREGHLAPTLRR